MPTESPIPVRARYRGCLRILAIGLLIFLCPRAVRAQLKLVLLPETTLRERLEVGQVNGKQRQQAVYDLFTRAGCAVTEQAITKKVSNVICTLTGESTSTITVGAHYDFIDLGAGIVDDWSGTAMLASLFETLKKAPRKHTFRFVAFAQEEKGLVGSTSYVKHLANEERSNLRAFVNLECLGLSEPKVWASRSDAKLMDLLSVIAAAIKGDLQGVNIEKVGDDDTHPFHDIRIPVLSLHSLTGETFGTLHSKHDQLAAIHMDYYMDAYRLAAFYLAYLDQQLE